MADENFFWKKQKERCEIINTVDKDQNSIK